MQYADVDLAAEGGYLRPLQKEFTVMPTGPNLIVELTPKVQHPILNGIEIYSREVEAEGQILSPETCDQFTNICHAHCISIWGFL